jgi:hypothetical protein
VGLAHPAVRCREEYAELEPNGADRRGDPLGTDRSEVEQQDLPEASKRRRRMVRLDRLVLLGADIVVLRGEVGDQRSLGGHEMASDLTERARGADLERGRRGLEILVDRFEETGLAVLLSHLVENPIELHQPDRGQGGRTERQRHEKHERKHLLPRNAHQLLRSPRTPTASPEIAPTTVECRTPAR